MEWAELRRAIRTRTAALARLLLSTDDAVRIEGSEWNVGEMGAHLVSVARRYQAMLAEPVDFPPSMAAMNDHELRAVETRHVDEVAALLEAEISALLEALGDDAGRPVPFYSTTMRVEQVGAMAYGEVLLHGLDLARTLDVDWDITDDDASTVLSGAIQAAAPLADPTGASRLAATYHLRVRRSHDWTIRVGHGHVTISEGRPAHADLHISADPKALLLTAYGRGSKVRAVLLGRVLAYGRRPWLSISYPGLFRAP